MQTLASSHLLRYRRLLSDQFPKTHLQKTTVDRQNLTGLGSALLPFHLMLTHLRGKFENGLVRMHQRRKFETIWVADHSLWASAYENNKLDDANDSGWGTFANFLAERLHQPFPGKSSLAFLSPLEAILFDIDGTLCDSDPLHYYAFREMLQEVGFNGGVLITEEFFSENLSGMHNEKLCSVLFPERDIQRARMFFEDKEAMFRRLAFEQLEPVKGLHKLCQWSENQGLKRAAVTNAPRPNGELLISTVELSDLLEIVVVGDECERAKPFPGPYLKALQALQVSNEHAFAFEDSVSGVKAGVAAGMPVVALGTRNPEISLINAGAAFVIEDFEDPKLWEALEEIERNAE